MEMNVGRRLTLPELARVAGLAPSHFHRVFSSATGESVQTHVRRLQLERAAFELFTSDRSVAEIASRSGYRTSTGFARAFGRHFGTSARRFRSDRDPAALIQAIPPDLRRDFAQSPVELREEPGRRVKFLRRTGPLMPLRPQGRDAVQRLLNATPSSRDAAIYKQTPDFPPITAPDKLRHDFAFDAQIAHGASDELIETRTRGGQYAVFHLGEGSARDDVVLHFWSYVYLIWAPQNRMRIQPFGAYERWQRRDGRLSSVEIHVQVQQVEAPQSQRLLGRTAFQI